MLDKHHHEPVSALNVTKFTYNFENSIRKSGQRQERVHHIIAVISTRIRFKISRDEILNKLLVGDE